MTDARSNIFREQDELRMAEGILRSWAIETIDTLTGYPCVECRHCGHTRCWNTHAHLLSEVLSVSRDDAVVELGHNKRCVVHTAGGVWTRLHNKNNGPEPKPDMRGPRRQTGE